MIEQAYITRFMHGTLTRFMHARKSYTIPCEQSKLQVILMEVASDQPKRVTNTN